jgi:hypothetical protein
VFLKKIGRDTAQYASKFKNWEDLMSCRYVALIKLLITSFPCRSLELKHRDIPCSSRKWILRVSMQLTIEPYLLYTTAHVEVPRRPPRPLAVALP